MCFKYKKSFVKKTPLGCLSIEKIYLEQDDLGHEEISQNIKIARNKSKDVLETQSSKISLFSIRASIFVEKN